MQPDQTVYPIPQALPPSAQTAFADGYPFLLVSTFSIAEVESNVVSSFSGSPEWAVKPPLEGEIGEKWAAGKGDILRRTRGNLIVGGKGGKAWDEDEWGVVKIGEEELVIVSMCGRCQLPNVDPSTGLTHPSIPYKVLSKYRRIDPVDKFSPCFGVNAAPMSSRGILRVGDKVRVVKKNEWIRSEKR
ncbi:hypothetical protein BDY24DRAFT_103152 [Mrakia frigida]|uniref:uncharacterized protein n=1 Tax=Mrakia frigida TaxID=29902 RepID=UPI003FCC0697